MNAATHLPKICRCLQLSASASRRPETYKSVNPLGDNKSLRSVRFYSVKAVTKRLSSVETKGNYYSTANIGTPGTEMSEWDLFVGVCLERKPVISKELNAVEKKYKDFLMKHEVELSKKSDHEIRHETDKILLEKLKSGESEQASVTTAQDFEDACSKEMAEFVLAPRKAEEGTQNDLKSLERSLDSHLLLAVNQKLGETYKWIVPHFRYTSEKSLREVAENGVARVFPSVQAKIVGNSPWGFYKYRYPAAMRTGTGRLDKKVGAKVFFYKAHILAGQILIPDAKSPSHVELRDYSWLTRAELPQYFSKEYFDKLSDFLIPEY